MSGAAPDPLDRIAESLDKLTLVGATNAKADWVDIHRSGVLALVEVARAARDLHAEVANAKVADTLYTWLEVPEDRVVALGAALARLDGKEPA